jgi:hypothetical protein
MQRCSTSLQEHLELLDYGIGLTNAARRTTRGSGDLRAVDFAGACERLEEIATTLAPRAIGFVGKAAPGRVPGAPAARPAGAPTRCDCALRPPLDLAGERRRASGERLRWFVALRELVGADQPR